MPSDDHHHQSEHRWPLAIVLSIVLQALAFSFWAGRISGTVDALTHAVSALRMDFSAHVNKH